MLSLPKKLAGKLTGVSAFERAANITIEATACDRSRINLEVEIMKLEKSQWRGYFDRVSKALVGKRAEIEVASLKLGDRIEAEWLPLLGISYDPKNDVIDIALEGLTHLIHEPREVYVEQDGLELSALEVVDAEDSRQIVVLKDPLMLPAPAQSTKKAS
jgi:hypothetical protein